MAKHSNVFYAYNKTEGFEALEKATGCKNAFGLDLFRHKGHIYEGRTGYRIFREEDLPNLASKIEVAGGIEKFNKEVEKIIANTGESPRYTRPDERRQDIFPPDPAKDNIVFAKDSYGKKHYFFRFDYEGVELFTLNNETDYFRQVYIECEGYMLALDQHHRLAEIKKWLDGLENGIKGEVEKQFNESMANPKQWVNMGYANILGRVDEANAHNTPIREARELERQQRDAEREAKRIADEQAAKEEYEGAITAAEFIISCKGRLDNTNIQGKSLIMQLFREHKINVPLKTQGWIIKSLKSVYFHQGSDEWGYSYSGNNSTAFGDCFNQLLAAVQTKQQYEEMTQNPCPLDGDTENDCADCVYAGDYHFQDGDCVQRGDEEENGDDMEI